MKIFKKFFNTFKFSNHDINNFILLLHKVHTHVNTWMIKEKHRETSLPKKEDVYKHLNMEDVTDADYTHAIRVCKGFKVKHLRENYDFYVQSDTLLLIYVFMNFRDIYPEMQELDPAYFFTGSGLALQTALKKTKVKLDHLTDIDMLLMVEKGIRGGICHAIHQYAKANNTYIKYYDKNKKSSYLKYWDVNNLQGWSMSQKLSVNCFKWVENTSQFNENFIKSYNDASDAGFFLEVDVQYSEKIHNLHNDLFFLPERMKTEKVQKHVANLHDKKKYVMHIRNLKHSLNH